LKSILEAHGRRIKAAMSDALGPGGKTKFIITAGDGRVCPMCQLAEQDGPIPEKQPYSNGLLHPKFHGDSCRCQEVSSEELAGAIEVKPTENSVDVGLLEPQKAAAAAIREYGSGNGPPNPAVRVEMDNIKDEVFVPLFNDLSEHYKKLFMK
jgi:hypothetical protein